MIFDEAQSGVALLVQLLHMEAVEFACKVQLTLTGAFDGLECDLIFNRPRGEISAKLNVLFPECISNPYCDHNHWCCVFGRQPCVGIVEINLIF